MSWTNGRIRPDGVQMEKLYAFLCQDVDYAPGKPSNIYGIFKRLAADAEPYIASKFYLVFEMRLLPKEWIEEEVVLNMELVNADGKKICSKTEKIVWDKTVDKPGRPKIYRAVVTMENIEFKYYGDYEFRLTVDDKELAAVPIYIEPG